MTFGFVYDDFAALEKNADVSGTTKEGQVSQRTHAHAHTRRASVHACFPQAANVWGIFVHDFWGQDISMDTSHKSYRPLTTLMYTHAA